MFRGVPRGSLRSSGSDGDQWEIGSQEGWCPDPLGRHESRWLSSGKPTDLVRDGGLESHDEPSDGSG